MLADGLNKGSIDRSALQLAVREGLWMIEHAVRMHPSQMPVAVQSQGQPELRGVRPIHHNTASHVPASSGQVM